MSLKVVTHQCFMDMDLLHAFEVGNVKARLIFNYFKWFLSFVFPLHQSVTKISNNRFTLICWIHYLVLFSQMKFYYSRYRFLKMMTQSLCLLPFLLVVITLIYHFCSVCFLINHFLEERLDYLSIKNDNYN